LIQLRDVGLGNAHLRLALLRLVHVENLGALLRTGIRALAIDLRRILDHRKGNSPELPERAAPEQSQSEPPLRKPGPPLQPSLL